MVKQRFHRWLPAIVTMGVVGGCTAIVGVDQDYDLDPGFGRGGSTLTGGAGAGPGGAGGSETGGVPTGGAAGTGGGPGTDGGKGGETGGIAGSAGTAGRSGSAGSAGTGGAAGTSGSSGAGGSSGSGVGGASGGGSAGTSGGAAGTGGSAGLSGSAGASGSTGSGGTSGSAGAAGSWGTGGSTSTGGSAGAAGSLVDAGDASADAPPDASSDGAADTTDGSPCGPGTKFCGVCVAVSDPDYGCTGTSCAPCEPHGTATCTSGSCVVTGCDVGYHQVGNVCVVNTPEVCTNGLDDDGDTRPDCLDSDCLGHPSCGGKCRDAVPIGCDTVVTGQNSGAAGSTSRISSYSCSGGFYGGSEYAYRFTGASNQRVYAEIYGLSGNLGLFEIGVPSGAQCVAAASCGASGDAANTSGAEALGFTAQAGQDYYLVVDGPNMPPNVPRNYSLSVQCSTFDGCWPVKPIEPGQNVSATNNTASAAPNVTANKVPIYDCASVGETGPEAAWIFTPTVSANYRASITGLSADCDLFVLSGADCGGTCLSPVSYSANSNQAPEFVTFAGVANTTYYIVVDGYLGSVCTFTLGLTQL